MHVFDHVTTKCLIETFSQ